MQLCSTTVQDELESDIIGQRLDLEDLGAGLSTHERFNFFFSLAWQLEEGKRQPRIASKQAVNNHCDRMGVHHNDEKADKVHVVAQRAT